MAGDIQIVIEAIDRVSTTMGTIKNSFTEFQSKMRTVEQGVRMVGRAIDETVGAFVEYADEVRAIMLVTGQQAEEVSRLIQVSDDYKITTDELTVAMRKMATEGMPLTIESLAKMSEEYLKLNPGTERQLFLMENFGRTGTTFAEIMLAGGEAIRDQSAAIEESLILTDKEVVAAREYQTQLDKVKDSAEGVKIALGETLLPTLVWVLEKVNEGVVAWQGMNEQLVTFLSLVQKAAPWATGAFWGQITGGAFGGTLVSSGTYAPPGGGRGTMTPPTLTTTRVSSATGFSREAAGGFPSSRYAIVGDRPGGDWMTPYTELVDFNTKRVYNNRDTKRMLGIGRYAAGGQAGYSEPGDVFTANPALSAASSGVFSRWESLGYGIQRTPIIFPSGGGFTTGVPTFTSGGGGDSGGALPGGGASSVATSVTQAVTAAAMSVSTVSSAAETISESGKKTEEATRAGTQQSALGDAAILRELQGLRKDIKTILPKAIKDGYQSVVSV